jgi:hypothetical protein
MVMITRETIYYINLRQAYFLAPRNASRISSRTVLFTDVPKRDLDNTRLRSIFHQVERIWIATDCKELEELIEDRDDVAFKLEDAEIELSQMANKIRLKEKGRSNRSRNHNPETVGSAAAIWVKDKKRPTHRTKKIVGKKVDTIEWARKELPNLIKKVKNEQQKHRHCSSELVGAVFIQFETQRAAQTAFQLTAHELPLHFVPRAVGIPPDQIIWKNLGVKAWKRTVRGVLATGFIALMVLFWSIPVAFIGALSNIDSLTTKVPFLSFINNLPPFVVGIITGLLPTVLLAALVTLVPITCRCVYQISRFWQEFKSNMHPDIAKKTGAVTLQEAELKTQNWYFAFQVIQVFLVTTFTSGAAAVVTSIIQTPTSAPLLLAKNLPKASNFYISYFILNGLVMASRTLLNTVQLIMFNVVGKARDKTPRQKYKRYIKLSGVKWGSQYPKWTNLGVIGMSFLYQPCDNGHPLTNIAIAYSCIAPLVLGFATIGFVLIYFAARYNSFFTQTTTIDSNGQAYGRALQQLMVGVYLSEICLIGLFALRTGSSAASSGPLVLMVLFLIATALYQNVVRRALRPLTRTLPITLLADMERRSDVEQEMEGGDTRSSDGTHEYDAHPNDLINTNTHSNGQLSTQRASESYGHKQGSVVHRFFNPEKDTSYGTLASFFQSWSHFQPLQYPPNIVQDAYLNPAISNETPVLWIVKDEMGISAQEITNSSLIIKIRDDGARFDEKGKIRWDLDIRGAPIWREDQEWERMI